jgi:hypothetical protein
VDIDAPVTHARDATPAPGGRIIPLTSPDGTYRRWFAEYDTGCALQRPDFRPYGTAATAASATALLDDLRQHLTVGSEDQQWTVHSG